jgi:hypothetical protein
MRKKRGKLAHSSYSGFDSHWDEHTGKKANTGYLSFSERAGNPSEILWLKYISWINYNRTPLAYSIIKGVRYIK